VDVFLSYARLDLEDAHALVQALREAGRSVWVDLEGLYVGEKWWPSIAKAIEAADVFVFLMTPSSLSSKACSEELNEAEKLGKRIIPWRGNAWRPSVRYPRYWPRHIG
jgi:TIR domain